MRRNALGSFSGTTPTGDDWKLGKRRGRERASFFVSFLASMSLWLKQMDDCEEN